MNPIGVLPAIWLLLWISILRASLRVWRLLRAALLATLVPLRGKPAINLIWETSLRLLSLIEPERFRATLHLEGGLLVAVVRLTLAVRSPSHTLQFEWTYTPL